ncbi:MAG: nucleoside transporter C-terminal domain-containing protein [Chitinophagales bacterium]
MIEQILRGLLGVAFLIGICYVFSRDRRSIDWKLVFTGLGIQFIFAFCILALPDLTEKYVGYRFDWFERIFQALANFFVLVIGYTNAGATFVLGDWPSVTNVNDGITGELYTVGFIFAFKVLPTVIFFSALTSLLYFLGILQKIVYGFAWVMSKTMHLSGAESLNAAGNIFLGQTESPLLIRPYLEKMTRSELLCVMVGGMATIAGGVMAAYIGFLGGDNVEMQKEFAMHLLCASIMSAPAAIVASKMLFPQKEKVDTNIQINKERIGSNALEAVANGTTDGLKLAVNVGAMLLAFTAFMSMFNSIFLGIGNWLTINDDIARATNNAYSGLSLDYIFGLVMSPVAWLLGTPSHDILAVGQLLGEKTIINEFIAYSSLGGMENTLDPKSVIIATYALCGFSNFASIGIQIGGIGALAPNQKKSLSQLGIRALLGGTIACFFTATIAGMIL